MPEPDPVVFVVDDDRAIRKLLERIARRTSSPADARGSRRDDESACCCDELVRRSEAPCAATREMRWPSAPVVSFGTDRSGGERDPCA